MRTFHALIIAGAILGAAWILKPEPVTQVSQAELQRREKLEQWWDDVVMKERVNRCATSIGKTVETLDLSDPRQETAYRKCMRPEESQSALSRIWNKIRVW